MQRNAAAASRHTAVGASVAAFPCRAASLRSGAMPHPPAFTLSGTNGGMLCLLCLEHTAARGTERGLCADALHSIAPLVQLLPTHVLEVVTRVVGAASIVDSVDAAASECAVALINGGVDDRLPRAVIAGICDQARHGDVSDAARDVGFATLGAVVSRCADVLARVPAAAADVFVACAAEMAAELQREAPTFSAAGSAAFAVCAMLAALQNGDTAVVDHSIARTLSGTRAALGAADVCGRAAAEVADTAVLHPVVANCCMAIRHLAATTDVRGEPVLTQTDAAAVATALAPLMLHASLQSQMHGVLDAIDAVTAHTSAAAHAIAESAHLALVDGAVDDDVGLRIAAYIGDAATPAAARALLVFAAAPGRSAAARQRAATCAAGVINSLRASDSAQALWPLALDVVRSALQGETAVEDALPLVGLMERDPHEWRAAQLHAAWGVLAPAAERTFARRASDVECTVLLRGLQLADWGRSCGAGEGYAASVILPLVTSFRSVPRGLAGELLCDAVTAAAVFDGPAISMLQHGVVSTLAAVDWCGDDPPLLEGCVRAIAALLRADGDAAVLLQRALADASADTAVNQRLATFLSACLRDAGTLPAAAAACSQCVHSHQLAAIAQASCGSALVDDIRAACTAAAANVAAQLLLALHHLEDSRPPELPAAGTRRLLRHLQDVAGTLTPPHDAAFAGWLAQAGPGGVRASVGLALQLLRGAHVPCGGAHAEEDGCAACTVPLVMGRWYANLPPNVVADHLVPSLLAADLAPPDARVACALLCTVAGSAGPPARHRVVTLCTARLNAASADDSERGPLLDAVCAAVAPASPTEDAQACGGDVALAALLWRDLVSGRPTPTAQALARLQALGRLLSRPRGAHIAAVLHADDVAGVCAAALPSVDADGVALRAPDVDDDGVAAATMRFVVQWCTMRDAAAAPGAAAGPRGAVDQCVDPVACFAAARRYRDAPATAAAVAAALVRMDASQERTVACTALVAAAVEAGAGSGFVGALHHALDVPRGRGMRAVLAPLAKGVDAWPATALFG